MAIYNITPIDVNTFESSNLTTQDQDLVTGFEIQGNIYYSLSKIELFVYDLNNNIVASNPSTSNWSIPGELPSQNSSEFSVINLDLQADSDDLSLDEGIYNFIYIDNS